MLNFINKQKALLANRKNGNPSEYTKVIGVTGSYGKTLSTHFLYDIFKKANEKVGLISSLGYLIGNDEIISDIKANNIQPGDIHDILGKMVNAGIEYVILEVTSNNLKLGNYEGINFDSGIITNISSSNPASYKKWEDYASTKLNFINKIKDEGLVVIYNQHHEISEWLNKNGNNITNNIFVHWVNPNDPTNIDHSLDQTFFDLDNIRYFLPLRGVDSLYSAILAIRLAQAYLPSTKISNTFSKNNVQSKIKIVKNESFLIFTDVMNTPEMFEESLLYLNKIKLPNKRLICIFGCEGERNNNRAAIGEIATKYSDMVILASNDSRSEKVYDINTDIQGHTGKTVGVMVERIGSDEEYKFINKSNLKIKIERVINNGDVPFIAFDADDFTSRLDAIDLGVKIANPGDIIYLSGKGDQTSLVFDNVEYEWSEEEAIKKVLMNN